MKVERDAERLELDVTVCRIGSTAGRTGNSPPARKLADSPEIARERRLGQRLDHAGLLEGAQGGR